jgi:hypothetical protein
MGKGNKKTPLPAAKKARTDESSDAATGNRSPPGGAAQATAPKDPSRTAPSPPPLPKLAAVAGAAAHTANAAWNDPPLREEEMADTQTASSAGATAPKTATTTTTNTTTFAQAAQSGAGKKASSGPQGTKRRLAVPDWTLGKSLFRVQEWDSYMRPPPKVAHRYVVFASLKDTSFTASDVIRAGSQSFSDLVAVDVFAASQQVALAFTTATAADVAAERGLLMRLDARLSLTRRADYQPDIRKLTVAGVDCTSPKAALKALKEFFTPYGRVLDVAPRYWMDTHIHTGVWHVTIDRHQHQVADAPPEVAVIAGQDVYIDIPGQPRVCRHCASAVHCKKDCKTWARLQARPEALAAYERQIASAVHQVELQTTRLQQGHQHQQQQFQKQQQQRKLQQQKQQQEKQQQQQHQQQQDQQRQQEHQQELATLATLSDEAFVARVQKRVELTAATLEVIEDEREFELALTTLRPMYADFVAARSAPIAVWEDVERYWREARHAFFADQELQDADDRGDDVGNDSTVSMKDADGDNHNEDTTNVLGGLTAGKETLASTVTVLTGQGTADPGTLPPPTHTGMRTRSAVQQ